MPPTPIDTWHQLVKTGDPSGLDALLAEDVVFHSPVVHTPQRGKALAAMYLHGAFQVFINSSFHYVREVVGARDAVLEFEVTLDGILVNGVDLVPGMKKAAITDFKVMVRPLKAISLIHQKMGELLQAHSNPVAP